MFTEKEMSDALKWLFDLYQPEDYEAYDEEEVGSVALCLPEICMALRDKVETPYEYTIRTNIDRGFEYRGKELFGIIRAESLPALHRYGNQRL